MQATPAAFILEAGVRGTSIDQVNQRIYPLLQKHSELFSTVRLDGGHRYRCEAAFEWFSLVVESVLKIGVNRGNSVPFRLAANRYPENAASQFQLMARTL